MKGRIIRDDGHRKKLPIIGKIKIGEKTMVRDKEVPRSLDHFVSTGKYKHIFDEKIGKVSELDIMFLSDDPMESCSERLEIRKGSKLFAYGDGHSFEVWTDGAYKTVTIDEDKDIVGKIEKKCDSVFEEVLTLYFVIIGINEVFGVWQFSTKGKDSSIPAIVSSFDQVLDIAGRIKFIPFTLSVEKVKSQKPESKSLFPVVSLVANIGQTHLEKLHNHIEGGTEFSGLLTEKKIDTFVMQIEHDKEIDSIDLEFAIVQGIEEKISKCNTIDMLSHIGHEIGSLDLPEKKLDELRELWKEKRNEFV